MFIYNSLISERFARGMKTFPIFSLSSDNSCFTFKSCVVRSARFMPTLPSWWGISSNIKYAFCPI